jgi:predicted MPP superfamily phosphohydrolase
VLAWVASAIAAAGCACVAYGVVIERHAYRLVRRAVRILPAAGPDSLTVLHLSDLHFVREDARKARFLASLPQADVTVVTGDFLGEPEGIQTAITALRPNRGRLASWFVLGSNDYFEPRFLNPLRYLVDGGARPRRAQRGRPRDLVDRLEADGWRDLTNVREDVDLDGLPVELLGLDDAHIRRQDLRLAPRRAPERFGFAVMHSPDSAPEAVACGYRFVVAGHTHGGQVRLPMLGALVTNSHLPRRVVSGLFRLGDGLVHVSPGLGTSKYAPFRFLCRPEATLIELRRAPSMGARRSTGSEAGTL